MQSCHICGESGTFFVLNFAIFAFGVGWGVKLSDPMSPESLKNCSDVNFLGDFKDAAFGVSVDTRLQRPSNFPVVGNHHVLAKLVVDHFSAGFANCVAQHKKVINMGPNQHPPPIWGSQLVDSIVVSEWDSPARVQELFQVLLPRSGGLFGPVKSFSETQNKFVFGEIGQFMTVWLLDPDFLINWGVDKSIFHIPMFASITCVRVVNAHKHT